MGKLMRTLGAGLMLAALAVTGATAQGDYVGQARSYLEAGLAPHAALGYAPDRTIPDIVQPLAVEGGYLWSVYLREGVNYRVYAACDNDCTDVDMEIYGADGGFLQRDVGTDDTPYVQLTPTATGRHYVRLWLFQCAQEPCYVAARVVSGGRPGDRLPQETQELAGGYEAVVFSELDAAGAAHLAEGYSVFGADVLEALPLQSDGYRRAVRLEGGRSFLFQGACDQDCSDVDLELLDREGRPVAADEAANDRPVVRYTPPRTGEYAVRIRLAACAVEPCYVGLRGYVR